MNTTGPMTQERLDAIRGRLDARTPGEWEASGREIDALAPSWGEVVSTEVNCMNYCYGGTGRGVERAEDADLIAHAPTDLTDLIAEVHRLRAELAKAREVTEETVERSARAAYGPKAWDKLDLRDPMTAVQRSALMAQIRTALETALGGGDDA